jgi:hypothetical protein
MLQIESKDVVTIFHVSEFWNMIVIFNFPRQLVLLKTKVTGTWENCGRNIDHGLLWGGG